MLTDFEIKEYPAGSGKFRLFVENSGVPRPDGCYTNLDGTATRCSATAIVAVLTFDADPDVDSDANDDTDSR